MIDSFNNVDNNISNQPKLDSIISLDLKDLQIIKTLGLGAGGLVKLVYHSNSNTFFALKVITLDIQDTIRKQIILELKTLHKTLCPYIVSFYDAFYTEGSIHIILEYMQRGSITDIIKQTKIIPEPILANIAAQVLQGLSYLHRQLHLIHRDIKPSNILINDQGEAKIADFGVSGQLQHTLSKAVTWVGTVTYMSPERITGRSYSFDSDIWSLGLTILEMALGKFPYDPSLKKNCINNNNNNNNNNLNNNSSYNINNNNINNNNDEQSVDSGIGFWALLDAIVKGPVPLPSPGDYSPEFCSFISECLQKEPEDRPTASLLLNHPFIKKYRSVGNSGVVTWMNQNLSTTLDETPTTTPTSSSTTSTATTTTTSTTIN